MNNKNERNTPSPSLSPEARHVLESSLSELRRDIIALATKEHFARLATDPEISAPEITNALRALNLVVDPLFEKRNFKSRRIKWFGLAATVAIVSILVLGQLLRLGLESASALAALIGVAGLVISIHGLWATRKELQKAEKATELSLNAYREAEFIHTWVELEAALRSLAEKEGGGETKRLSPSWVLRNYMQVNLSEAEAGELMDILQARNEIVHSTTRPLPGRNLDMLTRRLKYYVEKAESLLT
ncbi:hypothetical protein OHA25_40635 [Nonomuraea sp. NBC_00507]|uniref:hypothetical protein n=1 Tax=Nonomuraea sp. NBC_00507 TaxID=2976002 RepID=UPI002E1799B4